jgi:hypothetical protein
MGKTQHKIDNIDKEIQEAKDLYVYICENLAQPLIQKWDEKRQRGY